jgi:hypothetical protein
VLLEKEPGEIEEWIIKDEKFNLVSSTYPIMSSRVDKKSQRANQTEDKTMSEVDVVQGFLEDLNKIRQDSRYNYSDILVDRLKERVRIFIRRVFGYNSWYMEELKKIDEAIDKAKKLYPPPPPEDPWSKTDINVQYDWRVLHFQMTQLERLLNIMRDNVRYDAPPPSPESVRVKVVLGDGNIFHGDIVVAGKIKDSFNKAAQASVSDDLKALLKDLASAVGKMSEALPTDEAEEVARDLEILTSEATSKKPRQRWWQLSVEGLKKAAEKVGDVGIPVIQTAAKIAAILLRIK